MPFYLSFWFSSILSHSLSHYLSCSLSFSLHPFTHFLPFPRALVPIIPTQKHTNNSQQHRYREFGSINIWVACLLKIYVWYFISMLNGKFGAALQLRIFVFYVFFWCCAVSIEYELSFILDPHTHIHRRNVASTISRNG